jgi:DNA recombination protein RmuC
MAGMEIVVVVAAVVLGVTAGGVVVAWLGSRQRATAGVALQQAMAELQQQAVVQLREQAAAERDAAVDAAIRHVDRLTQERLHASVQAGRHELTSKQELIDQRLDEVRRDLSKELARVSELLAQLSSASTRSFGEVAARLQAHAETTEHLAATTQSLREALANPKARGQWGERMAEDVLRLAGFVEHVNYRKQRSVEGGRAIPDFTFPLPKGQVLYMDVKFPLAAYLRYLEATTDAERSAYRDTFLRDVRLRIKELAARDYADAARNSVDYVLLFLPNETVSGFIHEHDPALVDDALRQKVVLCSPLTLFAMLGVIRQAFDNFVIEQTADEILAVMGSFKQQYDRFTLAIDKLGRQLDGTQRAFNDLNTTRRRQLERPLAKLDDLRRSRGVGVDDELLPGGDVVELPAEAG